MTHGYGERVQLHRKIMKILPIPVQRFPDADAAGTPEHPVDFGTKSLQFCTPIRTVYSYSPSHLSRIACASAKLAALSRVAKKLKLQERRAVIPSRRSLAACRPLHFFEAINGALCGSADKWGETHGVGTYPGLHYGDGGPGAAAAE